MWGCLFLSLCESVCVCERERAFVCVCVCVCVRAFVCGVCVPLSVRERLCVY